MVSRELVTSPSLTDAEVVRRVLAGEVELFEVLVRRHDARVYRTARAILRDEAEAEDAMQASWLHAYQHLREFAGAATFSTWLVRIAVNEALGRLRRSRRAPLADLDEEGPIMDSNTELPDERAAAREAVRVLECAVDALPPAYRTVFVLREVEQLSTRVAAQALGIGEAAVKVRLHRARAMLRRALGAQFARAAPEAFPFLAPRCDRIAARVMEAITRLARGRA
jgi:RNA polymerase sigma-70 factor (ECF subfamily)